MWVQLHNLPYTCHIKKNEEERLLPFVITKMSNPDYSGLLQNQWSVSIFSAENLGFYSKSNHFQVNFNIPFSLNFQHFY